jgi:PncC family amidohydrolase
MAFVLHILIPQTGNMYDTKVIEQIRNYMIANSQTIAMAESVSSGHLQAAMSLSTDASDFFQGGITTYNIGQKCRHLQVEPTHASSCNCVSEKISATMAIEVSKIFLSDWGIAITGYATEVPELGITELFAYYSFSFGGREMQTKKIISAKMEALQVQLFYTNEILKAFAAFLSTNTK